ncbi:hypothetical protein SBDP1_920006 [Syntrophobacter sp. SbD1]|nr:hypothetical protein SBDP1_920006 [Syntrophobacter sp. SbD1]
MNFLFVWSPWANTQAGAANSTARTRIKACVQTEFLFLFISNSPSIGRIYPIFLILFKYNDSLAEINPVFKTGYIAGSRRGSFIGSFMRSSHCLDFEKSAWYKGFQNSAGVAQRQSS